MKSLVVIMVLFFFWPESVAGDRVSSDTRPEIREHYVMLYYTDLEKPAAFYGELLGLQVVLDDEWVKIYEVVPSSFIGIVKGGEGENSWHEPQARNAVMVSIVSENADAWYKFIKDSGEVRILKDIYNHSGAPIRAFLVEDPGGYTVEFFQWTNR